MTDPAAPLARTAVTGSGGTTVRTQVAAGRRVALVRAAVVLAAGVRAARGGVHAARRRLAQTVTPAGWLVAACATAGLSLGLAFGWIEWLVAGVAALVLLAASAPFLFGARGYDVAVRLVHERVVAGQTVTGEIAIGNVGRRTLLPGRLDLPVGAGLVELGVPLLRPGHVVAQPMTIPARRRGVIVVGPPTAVRSDPVGLLRREHEWGARHELYVHPRTVPVPMAGAGLVRDLEGGASRRLVDADMSFHAIREYAPGDAQRQVHWKSTAKTGRLMVRQFEESLRSRIAIVLSLAEDEYAGDDELELAVSAAASLGAQGVRDGRDVDVVTGAELPRVVRERMRSIEVLTATSPRALLDGFSRLDARIHTTRIEEVCRLAVEASEAFSLAFVVCGSRVPLDRLRRAELVFPPQTSVVAVVCDERAHPRRHVMGALTVLTVGVLDDLSALLLRRAQS